MRLPDWEQRLVALLHESMETPFAYGTHDCARFAGRAVEAVTGENPADRYKYTTELGARRLMKKGLDALVTSELGEPVAILQARRGDILYSSDLGCGPALAVCFGHYGLTPGSGLMRNPATGEVMQGIGGLNRFPLTDFEKAWHVG